MVPVERPSALIDLAGELLDATRAIGILGSCGRPDREQVEWAIQDYTPAIILLLRTLDQLAQESLLPADVPLLYHTQQWPHDMAPAGHSRWLRSDEYVKSILLSWNLQAITPKEVSATKFMRAALWVIRESGFLSAIEYMFSLLTQGFVTNLDAFSMALWQIFVGRRSVACDKDIVDFFLVEPDATKNDWPKVQFRENVLMEGKLRDDLCDDLDLLVDIVETQITAARAARDAAEWEIARARLGACVLPVLRVLRGLGANENLTYMAFDSRYDEINADTFARYAVLKLGLQYNNATKVSWNIANNVATLAKNDEHLEQFMSERVLVPDALVELLKKERRIDASQLPTEWAWLPPKLVPAWANVVLADTTYSMQSGKEEQETLKDVFGTSKIDVIINKCMELIENGRSDEALVSLNALCSVFPYFPFLRQERAICLDNLGQLDKAWDEIRVALLLMPDSCSIWQSAAVILRKSGRNTDGAIAAYIAKAIADHPKNRLAAPSP